MKSLFISADMEGCAGVAAPQALLPERWAWEWSAARSWMTAEVVSVAEAAFAVGYESVVVSDSHGNAHNIEPERLPENVWLVRSWPRPLLHMQGIESEGIEACAFVGYHAGAGDRGGILAHTYSGAAFRSIRLNQEVCSEGYLNAALAGEFGKAVVFVSGDDQTLADATRYAPEAIRFQSKRTIGWRSQMALPPPQICRQMKEAAIDALKRPSPSPAKLAGPYTLELEMTTQSAAEMLAYLPGVERIGAFTVTVTLQRLVEVMRFIAFAMLYSPNGVPAL